MNGNCIVKHFRLNNIDLFVHSGTEINQNSSTKVKCATICCPGWIVSPQTACSWVVWISQWLNHRLELSRPDKSKLQPHVLISWELLGFASRHTDEGCSIERLYQGIKKWLKSQDVKGCFPHRPGLWFGFSGQDMNSSLISTSARVPVCRSMVTEVLTPAYTLVTLHLNSLWRAEC